MSTFEDKRIYDALALPNEAISQGGVEILRAGLIDDELFVSARRVFKDPAQWGEVLGDIARRIALLYSAEDTDLTEEEILAEIEQAFAADLGAPVVRDRAAKRGKARKRARPARKTKSKSHPAASRPTKRRTAKTSARKPAKRKKS